MAYSLIVSPSEDKHYLFEAKDWVEFEKIVDREIKLRGKGTKFIVKVGKKVVKRWKK